MTDTPSYVSQPQVVDLPKLLGDVRAGHIQVPRFQRPFVWEDERRVELLRSLRAGIPIGSLLVWRTSQNRLPCFPALAGVKIPPPAKGQTVSYLLDGHQRLTTLFAAFSNQSTVQKRRIREEEPDNETPDPIYFDLEQNDFVVGNPTKSWSCLPLNLFLDAVALRQHFRVKEREEDLTVSELDSYQELAEGVLYAMQWCRIPVIPLSTDDTELATRTFQRVNSQGVPMTEFHMVAALAWGERFDLREVFRQEWAKQELPKGWEPAPEQQSLNVLKGLLGMEIARVPGDLLARRIRERPELAAQPVILLARAMRLASRLFVHSPVSVPYQLQMTLTAVALHGVDDRAIDDEFIRRWWGLTTVWGSFASAATHRVQAALRHLKTGLTGCPEPWPELLFSSTFCTPLPNLDLRNARARYFIDGYAQGAQLSELLNARGPRALISLAPGHGTRPGNRFIWASEDSLELGMALDLELHNELTGHFVDIYAIEAWKAGDVEKFIARREELMNAAEKKWFRGLDAEGFISGDFL